MKAGDTRRALAKLLDAGMAGTYQALALAAGLPEQSTRATLKEMSRCGQAAARDRAEGSGTRGRAAAVYGAPSVPIDPLAVVRQAWR